MRCSRLPGDFFLSLGQIGAERAGMNASIEMIPELGVVTPNQLESGPDMLGHQRTRALSMPKLSSSAVAWPDRGTQLVGQQFDLMAGRIDASAVVLTLRILEFSAQLLAAAFVFVAGLRVERLAGIAQVLADGQAVARRRAGIVGSSIRIALDRAHHFDNVDALAGTSEQMRDVAESFDIPQTQSF